LLDPAEITLLLDPKDPLAQLVWLVLTDSRDPPDLEVLLDLKEQAHKMEDKVSEELPELLELKV
jgi:hypothetical protein